MCIYSDFLAWINTFLRASSLASLGLDLLDLNIRLQLNSQRGCKLRTLDLLL